ncbi:hypothetical protein ACFQDN_26655 [Pseudomonas asuensis]
MIKKIDVAYESFTAKGTLKTPKTGEVIGENITIREALHKSLKWKSKITGGCNG